MAGIASSARVSASTELWPAPPSPSAPVRRAGDRAQGDEGRQWQVAGNAAEVYEGALVPAVFAPWAPLVVALANPQAGERVLDVACGTGVVSRVWEVTSR
jgi:hypothetical protein